MTKMSVVFVPGAWHVPEVFESVAQLLQAADLEYVGIHLPSTTLEGPYVQGIEEDISAIRHAIETQSDAGNDVVLVMHSYGGVPGSSACKGLSKVERREQGKLGGIVSLVYLSAFALEEGMSLATILGPNLLPWIIVQEADTYAIAEQSRNICYNDLSDEEAARWETKLQRQATKVFSGKVTYAAWKHIPSHYVVCTLDNAIPPPVQEGMAQQGGMFVSTETLATGHSPFLSKPNDTAAVIQKIAQAAA